MAQAIPHNALLHDDNSHLYCEMCKTPLHTNLMQDVIQLSIDAVREQIALPGTTAQMWAGARGEENYRKDNPNLGDNPVEEIRVKGIDPIYVKALEQVREGLTQYPIQGGLNLRHEDGSHLMEHIFRNQTGSIGSSPAAIGKFILDNNIKGHTKTHSHGLSSPSKMWGPSEDTPTWGCPLGSKLRGIPGSVCEGCYVDSNMNMRSDPAQKHQARNLLGLANPQMYAAALSWQIGQAGNHDKIRLNSSGDVQNAHHFAILSDLASAHPDKQFWLATREHDHLKKFLEAGGRIPPNLTVRVSQHMQHQTVHDSAQMRNLMESHPNITGSSVNASHKYDQGEVWVCPAAGKQQPEGTCEYQNCDACWDPNIKAIDYTGHGSANIHPNLEGEELSQAQLNEIFTQIQLRDKMMQSQSSSSPDLSQFGI